MRKTQEVERFRLPLSAFRRLCSRAAELEQARLVGMQLQPEPRESLAQLGQKLIGILTMLESRHEVVSKTHNDHIAVSMLPSPSLNPQVEYVVQVDVRQQRADTPALNRSYLTRIRFPSSSTPALSHFWINRTTRRSAIRCSTNFTSHP